jgi:hypothetical protein
VVEVDACPCGGVYEETDHAYGLPSDVWVTGLTSFPERRCRKCGRESWEVNEDATV